MEDREKISVLKQVTKIYEGSSREESALENVTFTAHAGELILLLGPSGSGKTTLLTLLAGFQRPTHGNVFLFGKRVQDYSNKEMQRLRARKMGFVFQNFCLIESLTALENVVLVLQFAGMPQRRARSIAAKYLERFEISHLANAYPGEISQGEKQRVAVARALANEAPLIIADEPTANLATVQAMAIVELLKEWVVREQRCVVIASHDERIAQYADRVLHLRDGTVVSSDTVPLATIR